MAAEVEGGPSENVKRDPAFPLHLARPRAVQMLTLQARPGRMSAFISIAYDLERRKDREERKIEQKIENDVKSSVVCGEKAMETYFCETWESKDIG